MTGNINIKMSIAYSSWYNYNLSISLYFPNFLQGDYLPLLYQKIASTKLYTDTERDF